LNFFLLQRPTKNTKHMPTHHINKVLEWCTHKSLSHSNSHTLPHTTLFFFHLNSIHSVVCADRVIVSWYAEKYERKNERKNKRTARWSGLFFLKTSLLGLFLFSYFLPFSLDLLEFADEVGIPHCTDEQQDKASVCSNNSEKNASKR